MWPGSAPTVQPRRRRRARGIGASAAMIERIAIREGIATPPKPKGDVIGVCAEHAYAALGFSSPHAFCIFLDDLARRRPPRRPRAAMPSPVGVKRPKKNKLAPPEFTVRLPRWKNPPGVVRVVAVRCPNRCIGGGQCDRCGGHGWSVRLHMRESAKTCEHAHT